MRAVFLAAGMGTRMGAGTPKSLLKIGDKAIIERNFELLERAGLDISIVIGYHGWEFTERFGNRATYIYNYRYATTGSLYSLWVAAQALRDKGGLIACFADVFADPAVIIPILYRPNTITVLPGYDGRGTRVYVESDRVAHAGEPATPPDKHGVSFSGFAHLSADRLSRLPGTQNFEHASLTAGLVGCRALLVATAININTPEDLEYVRETYGTELLHPI